MSSSILRSRATITRVLERDRCEIIDDGALLIEDGTIAEVSTYDTLSRRLPHLPVHGTAGDIAMPGLVNAHHHVGLTPFQLGAPDLPLELWVIARMAARDVDPYLDTLCSAFELISSGVTTVQHIFDTAEGTLAEVKARLDAVVRAYRDIGMRASVCYSIADQNHLVHQSNAEFLAGLPPVLREPLAASLDRIEAGLDGGIELFQSLSDETRGDPRIRVQLALANLHWCSDEALTRIARLSEDRRAPIHMHLLETPYQRDYAEKRFGMTAFEYLARFGLPGPRLTLGHGVWMSPDDIGAAAAAGTSVCINCSSNLRLSSGRAPLAFLERAGVNLAIGIDEAGLNDDRDMLQEMRLLHTLHREPGVYADAPTAGQVLRAATGGGALTTPFAGSIGTLEAGRRADVSLIDWRKLSYPYLSDAQPLADVVLRRAKPQHVRLVMCDGEVIFRDGRFLRVDQTAAMHELHSRMLRADAPSEQARRQLAADLIPHVRRFFGMSGASVPSGW